MSGGEETEDRVVAVAHPRKRPKRSSRPQIVVLVVPPEKVEETVRAFPGSRAVTLRELGEW